MLWKFHCVDVCRCRYSNTVYQSNMADNETSGNRELRIEKNQSTDANAPSSSSSETTSSLSWQRSSTGFPFIYLFLFKEASDVGGGVTVVN